MSQTAQQTRSGGTRDSSDKPFGPVAAAFLAAGIGAVVLGILTTLAEANEDIKSALEWSESVGPLMGKTILATGTFFVSWLVLGVALRDRDPKPQRVFVWVAVLVVVGVLLTFPTFFQAFAPSE
jgi:hypothetical protein